MTFRETHDVSVTVYNPSEPGRAFAEVRAATYPDGDVKNTLDAGELREVAAMLEKAADELEK